MVKVYNLVSALIEPAIELTKREKKYYEDNCMHNIGTRFNRIIAASGVTEIEGDRLLYKINDLFHNGMGIKWSDVQVTIKNACIDALLPKIYGMAWDSVKTRVLKSRGLDKVSQEVLIQMARRNGKTYVVSGVAAALLLVVPDISIAIFSVTEKQSKMLKTEVDNRINSAWEMGTHVKPEDYTKIESNKQNWIYRMNATGTKQILGSFPGSTKVKILLFSCFPKNIICANTKKCPGAETATFTSTRSAKRATRLVPKPCA